MHFFIHAAFSLFVLVSGYLKSHDINEMQKSMLTFKTGTTIVGVCCKDGIVLGADSRSTMGPLVGNKEVLKVHPLAPKIYCCGAGTSADCEQITRKTAHMLGINSSYTYSIIILARYYSLSKLLPQHNLRVKFIFLTSIIRSKMNY